MSLLLPRSRLGRRLALAYLLVVAAAFAFLVVTTVVDDPGEPSFAGIWPILATAPTSLVVVQAAAPDSSTWPAGPSWLHGDGGLLAVAGALTLACALVNVVGATLAARLVDRLVAPR